VLAGKVMRSVVSIRPFPLYILDLPPFDIGFACVWVITTPVVGSVAWWLAAFIA